MICPTCEKPTSRLIIDKRGKGCADCRGISEAGGVRLDSILTRNSDRVRAQQHSHEGDMIIPHKHDPLTGKDIPNPDFVDKYPEQLPNYFTEDELKAHGYTKAGKIFKAKAAQERQAAEDAKTVEYAPDPGGEKLQEVIKDVQGTDNSGSQPEPS